MAWVGDDVLAAECVVVVDVAAGDADFEKDGCFEGRRMSRTRSKVADSPNLWAVND